MLCLSQTTGYAVRALGCLQQERCRNRFIRDIAKCTGIPGPYLARIINNLTHRGLVVAKRGYDGGITLARPSKEISLLQIVEAVEGPNWLGPCLLNIEECLAPRSCPTHAVWQRVSRQLKDVLSKTTLADVVMMRKKTSTRRRTCSC